MVDFLVNMNQTHKGLARVYFVLSAAWLIYGFIIFLNLDTYHKTIVTASLGLLVGLGISLFGFIHLKVSKNIQGTLGEKSFAACSFANVVMIVAEILCLVELSINGERSMLGYGAYIIPFFIVITGFLTFLFGIFSILKVNKKILSWTIFLLVVIGAFLEAMNVIFWS